MHASSLTMLRELALIATGFVGYMVVRGFARAERGGALDHGRDLLAFERSLGIDWERGIQRWALNHDALMNVANAVYAWSYWPILIGTLVYLWYRDRGRYVYFRNAMFVSGALGLVVFSLYPVAPPRMLEGFTDTVSEGSRHFFVDQAKALINPYAALPSFHSGWFVLAGVVLLMTARQRWSRVALVVAIPIMPFAVVLTANHYLVDVVLGVTLSIGALLLAMRTQPAVLSLRDTSNHAPTLGVVTAARSNPVVVVDLTHGSPAVAVRVASDSEATEASVQRSV